MTNTANEQVLLLVYILYIIFQLKSHSYLYASIPQQIIDEESHPGILAELMNSSDSSSSSSDDSDDTTASWTTAKRLKRAMKYRRHRKSSASSKGTASHSIRKNMDISPMTTGEHLGSGGASSSSHPDDNGSCAVDFGDDARYDADDDAKRFNEPHYRDFGQKLENAKSSKKSRKAARREQKQRRADERTARQSSNLSAPVPPAPRRPTLKPHMSEPYFDRSGLDVHEACEDIPKRKSPFRPTMPSLLTNNVFSNTQGTAEIGEPSVRTIRRTNSLPGRMNRLPAAGNAVQYARGAAAAEAKAKAAESSAEVKEPDMSRTAAVVLLLISTALVAVCAEFLVDAIPQMIANSAVSEAFIGLIILPIVSNAAEHVTAVAVATKNKMDLAIGVSVGSSIQIGMSLP